MCPFLEEKRIFFKDFLTFLLTSHPLTVTISVKILVKVEVSVKYKRDDLPLLSRSF
jgi:hypothetical protein